MADKKIGFKALDGWLKTILISFGLGCFFFLVGLVISAIKIIGG